MQISDRKLKKIARLGFNLQSEIFNQQLLCKWL